MKVYLALLFFLGAFMRTVGANPGEFPLAANARVASIYADTNDFWGVRRAVGDLQRDIQRVTGIVPVFSQDEQNPGTNVIVIGSLGKNRLIERWVREGRIDVTPIAGKWESFLIQMVPHPMPGVENALVIAGSDKRGAIYGAYDLSQKIGVSPWYWWADVSVKHRDVVYVKAGPMAQGPPAVKYRGIFLNDEAPDLTGWAKEKFGGYNHSFYTNVFELLLRLKANYLWPAMWDNCFNQDDPLNPKLADDYGIVMGTSHVEPMMRADKEWNRAGHAASEWNYEKNPAELDAFWKAGLERNKAYENIITIAMRGKIDTPMSESANIALLEKIVAAQRGIIAEVMATNASSVPQLWALYKEVQEYYEKGMRAPDDVTLLWCDDNWGNVRRLPTPEEKSRAGGAGIYYHFDYVGGPRNYKWINSTPITKVWEQMSMAYDYGVNRIWIVNVGHLEHVIFPMEFFLTLAWSPTQWPKERISEFTRLWAERNFSLEQAPAIADLMAKFTKYNARRKPELLDATTFSLVNYQEADTVVAAWNSLVQQAEEINRALPGNARDAFYEALLGPVQACANLNELYLAVAKNHLYEAQGRSSASDFAAQARALFARDAELSSYFNHTLAGGKWDHMMDQTHLGYTYWQQPSRNAMPPVLESAPQKRSWGMAVEESTNAWPSSTGLSNDCALPPFDVFNQARHYIDIFKRDQAAFSFTASTSDPWIKLSTTQGTVDRDARLWVSVDWESAPKGTAEGSLQIHGPDATIVVKVHAFNPPEPSRDTLQGFVEADGCVAMEAEHYSRKLDATAHWEKIDDYGRTLASMAIFPTTAASVTPPAGAACLEYRMYLFDSGPCEVRAIIAPTLNFVPGRGLRYAISFDDQPPQVIDALAHNSLKDWESSVKDSARTVIAPGIIDHPGYHTLKFQMVDPGIVLQKLTVNFREAKPSYLGPPESYHRLP